jgi:hypothetical protein
MIATNSKEGPRCWFQGVLCSISSLLSSLDSYNFGVGVLWLDPPLLSRLGCGRRRRNIHRGPDFSETGHGLALSV